MLVFLMVIGSIWVKLGSFVLFFSASKCTFTSFSGSDSDELSYFFFFLETLDFIVCLFLFSASSSDTKSSFFFIGFR